MGCRDDLAVVLKRQLQAQSRMPRPSTTPTQHQMLADLLQGLAGAPVSHLNHQHLLSLSMLPCLLLKRKQMQLLR